MAEISEKVAESLNEQVKNELYSGYLYLSMSAHFEEEGLSGIANWFKLQANEELEHGMKIFGYVLERGGGIELQAIDKPPAKFDSVLSAFEDAYGHEQKVTRMIEGLVSLAREERDYATESFLQWFIDEQVEEEATASGIVCKLKMIGDKKHMLLMLDRELGQRKRE